MRQPRSYIVRIYRQGFRSLAGMVEDTRSGGGRPFRSAEELLALLRVPAGQPPRRRGNPRSTG
jgi:hypothetical protein